MMNKQLFNNNMPKALDDIDFLTDMNKNMKSEIKSLITNILDRNSNDRPCIDVILDHVFFTTFL